jgi:wyosine [tRNA(Phe)-imidazoG37] synthetase (radical SAM superfamily)
LTFEGFFDGLNAFRREFSGEYWLEVFVVPGVNDDPERMGRIARLAERIGPDRIHLNTAVRPAQDGLVKPVPSFRMAELAGLFNPIAEVIGVAVAPAPAAPAMTADELVERILGLIQRHPVTTADLCATLGAGGEEVDSAVTVLLARGVIRIEGGYYVRAIDL